MRTATNLLITQPLSTKGKDFIPNPQNMKQRLQCQTSKPDFWKKLTLPVNAASKRPLQGRRLSWIWKPVHHAEKLMWTTKSSWKWDRQFWWVNKDFFFSNTLVIIFNQQNHVVLTNKGKRICKSQFLVIFENVEFFLWNTRKRTLSVDHSLLDYLSGIERSGTHT